MSGVPQGHLRHLFADRHGSYDRACAGDGDGFAAQEALRLLEEALPTHQDDPEVLTRLDTCTSCGVTWNGPRASTIAPCGWIRLGPSSPRISVSSTFVKAG